MNLIYQIIFTERELNNEFPCYYIGSKVDSIFDGTNILDKSGNIYPGSPKSKYTKLYETLINSGKYKVKILGVTNQDPRKIENIFQKAVNVVTNEKYFNKTYASDIRRYDAPNCAAYKNTITGKIAKLYTHEVTSDWVGVRKDSKLTIEHIEAIKKSLKEYWTDEAKAKQSIKIKEKYLNPEYALKIKNTINSPEVKEKYKKSLKEYWDKPESRIKASITAKERNSKPEFKKKFRKSRSRGTWIEHEDELKTLWNALGKPSYITFRKRAIEHGFNDENYQGAIRSWSNYYVNRKMK